MDDAALIERQQDEIETLRERVRQLEERLAPQFAVPVEWALTGKEALMFAALVARGEASKQALMDALYSDKPDGDEPEIKIVDVFICKLRKKLRPYGIEIQTIWGRGYALPDEVRARFRQISNPEAQHD